MAQLQVQKVNWWHERFIDWMIANPDANIKDAAPLFDVSVNTLYLIKNSDAFKKKFAERSLEVSGAVDGQFVGALSSLPEKLAALADSALDELNERMEKKGRDLPIENVQSLADMALKKLGYGGQVKAQTPPTQVTVQFTQVNAADVAEARRRMEQKAAPALIEMKPDEEKEAK